MDSLNHIDTIVFSHKAAIEPEGLREVSNSAADQTALIFPENTPEVK
jgi:hypothetical protein